MIDEILSLFHVFGQINICQFKFSGSSFLHIVIYLFNNFAESPIKPFPIFILNKKCAHRWSMIDAQVWFYKGKEMPRKVFGLQWIPRMFFEIELFGKSLFSRELEGVVEFYKASHGTSVYQSNPRLTSGYFGARLALPGTL